MNKETFWRVALPLGIVLWTLLIWGQSLLPAKISAAASQAVEQTLVPDAEHMTMEDYVQPKWWTKYFTLPNHPLGPSFFVRKGAHLAEFGVLGVLWCACSRVYGRRFLWLFGLPIGVIDECLQLVSRRGALVADAIVDVAGYLLGCGLMLAIGWIWRKKQK